MVIRESKSFSFFPRTELKVKHGRCLESGLPFVIKSPGGIPDQCLIKTVVYEQTELTARWALDKLALALNSFIFREERPRFSQPASWDFPLRYEWKDGTGNDRELGKKDAGYISINQPAHVLLWAVSHDATLCSCTCCRGRGTRFAF